MVAGISLKDVLIRPQNKLEAQYIGKRQAHESEVQDLKQQMELKSSEIRNLNAAIDGLKSVNEELKVCFLLFLCRVISHAYSSSARSRSPLLGSKEERTWLRVLKILSELAKRSVFSWPSLTASRRTS